jgi:hypothetical protein
MKAQGACHCGAIRYEAEIESDQVSICHCSDCQVLTGTAFRVSVPAVPGTLRWLSGSPRVYTKTAESGRPREQGFCERCGTPLYATSPGPEPRLYNLRVGPLAQREQLIPMREIWCRSELSWLGRLGTLQRSEKSPG